MSERRAPGEIRDAIIEFMSRHDRDLTVSEIQEGVSGTLFDQGARSSSIRSYLRLNTPKIFERTARGTYRLRASNGRSNGSPARREAWTPVCKYGRSRLYHADCFDWLNAQESNSVHALVTDPPYGLVEYNGVHQRKLRAGRGGVWRIPPSFDGNTRSPLPRFTTLNDGDRERLGRFFYDWGRLILRVLVPGANVIVASNPLVSYLVSKALDEAGLERRGEIIRLVRTMRGGDRPKNAHEEFPEVSVMPRSMWEPWIAFRKPVEGRVQDNLRRWGTGGFRRPSPERPFGDVIQSAPTHKSERNLADHPSLKPQKFLRQVVRAALPLGEGVVLDPFAGSGSTLAAAEAAGYESIGVEADPHYVEVAKRAVPRLVKLNG